MLLELYKKVRQLEIKVEQMDAQSGGDGKIVQEVRGISSLLELVGHGQSRMMWTRNLMRLMILAVQCTLIFRKAPE
jgi:hypothetical protein